MSDPDQLLQKARNNRDLAHRARDMSRFLTQRADVECVRAYACELEALALEMERLAARHGAPPQDDAGHPDRFAAD